MRSGSHHLVDGMRIIQGLTKYGLMVHGMTWESERLILAATLTAVVAGPLGEEP